MTSGLSSGGNISRNAGNAITDVGTRIEGGGDLNQSAKTITSLAAADTTYSSSNSTTHTAKVGAYAEAEAEVSATGAAGPGASKPVKKEAGGGAGIRASYQYDNESEQSGSSNAVAWYMRLPWCGAIAVHASVVGFHSSGVFTGSVYLNARPPPVMNT